MKDNKNKHLKMLGQKIAKYEEEIAMGKNIQDNQSKIQNIMESLSIEDLYWVTAYIDAKASKSIKNY